MLNLLLAIHLFCFQLFLSGAVQEEVNNRDMAHSHCPASLHSIEEPLTNFVSYKNNGPKLSENLNLKKTDHFKSKSLPASFDRENQCAIVFILRCDHEDLNLFKISRETSPRSPPSATA